MIAPGMLHDVHLLHPPDDNELPSRFIHLLLDGFTLGGIASFELNIHYSPYVIMYRRHRLFADFLPVACDSRYCKWSVPAAGSPSQIL